VQLHVSRDMATAFGLGGKHDDTFAGGLQSPACMARVLSAQSSVDTTLCFSATGSSAYLIALFQQSAKTATQATSSR